MEPYSGASARVRLLTWLVPAAVCIFVFWPGVMAWFQRDDFAWLGLRNEIFDSESFWRTMFAPKAQGTIRPWSERGFFLLYSKLFGLDALPYRLTVFATQTLAMYLLSRVAWRLSGSALAAFLAPLFWGVNTSLGTPLSWTSAYNQVMCAAFLLGAFLVWLEFAETGRRSLYAAQFAIFLLGFGALEINIVYPAIVVAWCVLTARWRLAGYAAAMLPVSALYFLLHNHFAPKASSGLYALHVDSSMLGTLGRYWHDVFVGQGIENLSMPDWLVRMSGVSPWILTVCLMVFVGLSLWKKRWVALFGLAWFAGALAPVLPLRDHYSIYYLTIPSIGIAMLGADAVAAAWRWRPARGAIALLAAAMYVATSAPVGRGEAQYFRTHSEATERLVLGVQRARELHPKEAILLTDVSADLFWSAINDRPFRVLGIENVFLAPGAEEAIPRNPELGDVDAFVFPVGQVLRLLDHRAAVVYSAVEGQLRNVTSSYSAIAHTRWKASLAKRVDVGNSLFSDQLQEGWHKNESGFRWMARQGGVLVGGPGRTITVSGYVAKEVVEKGPVLLTVLVDGVAAGPPFELNQPNADFRCRFPIPNASAGKESMRVVLSLNKAILPPGEDREMGVILGIVEVE